MKIRFLLCLGLCFYEVLLFGQQGTRFPENYLGIYKGTLQMTSAASEQSISMEFKLEATETEGKYQYQIVYINEGNRQERSYTLITIDAAKGDYLVDENNGIQLQAKLLGNKLFSVFQVEKSLLMSTQTFFKDYMLFEIVFSRSDEAITSGNDGNAIPEVFSYPVSVYQFAKLEKQNN
jgi:hypothetical protein